jgi:hypothetical protein
VLRFKYKISPGDLCTKTIGYQLMGFPERIRSEGSSLVRGHGRIYNLTALLLGGRGGEN